ncbi:GNAT family N-acetyltransferase [Microbacterium sp. MC2]
MVTTLRPWHPGDATALWEAVASTPDLDRQFGGWRPESVEDCVDFIGQHLVMSPQTENWAISVDGRAVGHAGISAIEHRHDSGWVYYWLATGARGRGLATRALATLAMRAFDDLGLFRLELAHRVNNPASCAVALRAGFAVEGVERQKLRYDGERFDTETHARLRTDPVPEVQLLPFAD